jgi:hypothetical protein
MLPAQHERLHAGRVEIADHFARCSAPGLAIGGVLLDLDTAQRQREGAVPDTDAMKALPSHEPGQKHRLDLQIYVPKLLVSPDGGVRQEREGRQDIYEQFQSLLRCHSDCVFTVFKHRGCTKVFY